LELKGRGLGSYCPGPGCGGDEEGRKKKTKKVRTAGNTRESRAIGRQEVRKKEMSSFYSGGGDMRGGMARPTVGKSAG
jgi:hypothetical protein